MKKYLLILFAIITLSWMSCDTLKSIENTINAPAGLTETEIVSGLKEALEVGTALGDGPQWKE